MHWPWVNMDMVMLGKMCVCWFLDRQVVPRCPGGLQKSRGHVSSLHGWQKHTHTYTSTYKNGLCGRNKDNDSKKHLWCSCLAAVQSVYGYNTNMQAIDWSTTSIRHQPFSHFRRTRTHTETLRQKEYLWGAGCHYWKAIWGVPILWWQGCSLIKHGV